MSMGILPFITRSFKWASFDGKQMKNRQRMGHDLKRGLRWHRARLDIQHSLRAK